MRKLIMLILIAVFALFVSIIVVDESQDAVVRTNKQVVIYTPGIHVVIPLFNQISYIYMNERSSRLSVALENGNIELMVMWHVVDPVQYDIKVHESEPFAVHLVANLNKALVPTISASNLADLNQYGFKDSNYTFKDLGVSVDKVSILSISESNVITK